MKFNRTDQVNNVIARAIAEILPNFFRGKRYGLITVTGVHVNKSMDSAVVRVSVLRNAHHFSEDAKKHSTKIYQELKSKVVLKKIPKIILELDPTSSLLTQLDSI